MCITFQQICDFGLARSMYIDEEEDHAFSGSSAVPISVARSLASAASASTAQAGVSPFRRGTPRQLSRVMTRHVVTRWYRYCQSWLLILVLSSYRATQGSRAAPVQ